ncbi:MAG: citrate synthase [Candidatus Lokiarchaeota archaeon]|nr:citrate synthase [Candidatus Lokiarchaeota archaeon]
MEENKEGTREDKGDDLESKPIYKGLVGVVVDTTEICSIDGIKGSLYYRGYPIRELVEYSSFEEVAFLLLFGKLPSRFELEAFKDKLIQQRDIPDRILIILKSFPRNTTRIELLRTAISALSLYDEDDYDYSEQANIRKGMRIIGKIPTILAYSHRIQSNLPLVEPDTEGKLSHAANFYYMMTGNIPTKLVEDAFDKLLICHAEHALNTSTFAARVTVSTLSDIYSAIVSAIGTLRGPLHGGANERVILYMLNEIKTKKNVIPWAKEKIKNKEKIMGFGHRVYKTWDPRAYILREYAKKFSEMRRKQKDPDGIPTEFPGEEDVDSIFQMTEKLVDYVVKKKGIYPNVDLFSAPLLHGLGVPTPLYTPLFASSRCVGWVAHSIEQLKNNKLIRPRLRFQGELNKKYVPLDER